MYDIAIIGQGIAGSFMAYHCIKHHIPFVVIDDFKENSSSRVAAGLFNPISFKRISKVQRADEYFTFLHTFYPELEQYAGEKFFFPVGLRKFFSSEFEQNEWIYKSDALKEYIILDHNHTYPNTGMVAKSGYVNTRNMLNAVKNILIQKGVLLQHSLKHENISIDTFGFRINLGNSEIKTKKIIFCEGYQVINNPFFKDFIKMAPTKGELIDVYAELPKIIDCVLHKNGFIVPMGNNLYKVGTTYDRNDLSDEPSLQGKQILMDVFEGFDFDVSYKIIHHEASVRPTTMNRLPVCLEHPSIKNMHMINGLGSRGVSIAPLLIHEYFKKSFF